MNLTTQDLQWLVDRENNNTYEVIYGLVEQEFERVFDGLNQPQDDETLKTIGTCGIYLRSISEMLHTIKDLIGKGFIESAGTISTAIWERSITLRKILLDPQRNAQVHTEHEKAKITPWKIYDMVKEITIKHSTDPDKINKEIKLFYLQYTFLSAIKHGNPYTLSYLNRPGRTINEKNIFAVQGNDCYEDEDLKIYLMILSMDNALDALVEFTAAFRNANVLTCVKELRKLLTANILKLPLKVPTLLITSPEEMGQEFWDFLQELDATPKPTFTGNLI